MIALRWRAKNSDCLPFRVDIVKDLTVPRSSTITLDDTLSFNFLLLFFWFLASVLLHLSTFNPSLLVCFRGWLHDVSLLSGLDDAAVFSLACSFLSTGSICRRRGKCRLLPWFIHVAGVWVLLARTIATTAHRVLYKHLQTLYLRLFLLKKTISLVPMKSRSLEGVSPILVRSLVHESPTSGWLWSFTFVIRGFVTVFEAVAVV